VLRYGLTLNNAITGDSIFANTTYNYEDPKYIPRYFLISTGVSYNINKKRTNINQKQITIKKEQSISGEDPKIEFILLLGTCQDYWV